MVGERTTLRARRRQIKKLRWKLKLQEFEFAIQHEFEFAIQNVICRIGHKDRIISVPVDSAITRISRGFERSAVIPRSNSADQFQRNTFRFTETEHPSGNSVARRITLSLKT